MSKYHSDYSVNTVTCKVKCGQLLTFFKFITILFYLQDNILMHLNRYIVFLQKVITCYLCGESGHSGKNCTNPICYNCNKPGHINVDCTGPRRSRYTDCHRCQMLGHTAYVR